MKHPNISLPLVVLNLAFSLAIHAEPPQDAVLSSNSAASSLNVAMLDEDAEQSEGNRATERWTGKKAWQWHQQQPWLVGFNYVPSTACNTTEWWQADSFDLPTMDRELSWAADLGFNTTRCFIQYLVWKNDPDGLKDRFNRFLAVAQQHGITVMPVLFDDCAFGDPPQMDPYLGEQREPIPGMILPSWTPSPGRTLGLDPAELTSLEKYVGDMVATFGKDPRVIMWDLYNEPMNVVQVGTPELLGKIFAWARAAEPTQPLTVSVWNDHREINEVMLAHSDVISFHRYGPYEVVRGVIQDMKRHGRPVVCTEWMARPAGSRIETDLPLFKREAVGCYMWGFVNGRTQAQFPWWNKPEGPIHEAGWFHDILHADGTPYRPEELAVIRRLASRKSRMDNKLMMYADMSSGRPFAKDPGVARFRDRYWMYYSKGPDPQGRWAMGIAASEDLTHWEKVGEILPAEPYEAKGLVAPGAIVLDGKLHLFYCTYGNGKDDAICHAWSEDGVHFQRNPSNPIFRPHGDWNNGRAIDAEVFEHEDQLLLYCATRDPAGKIQMLVGAASPRHSDFGRDTWKQFPGGSLLRPELPWEKQCIEAPTVCRHGDQLYMFYAGAYNNQPQQIGVATSADGRHWRRLSTQPILPNGLPGEWNSSESGHPGVFADADGDTYLFFQGNADGGKTWYLSKMLVDWEDGRPVLIRPGDGHHFRLPPRGEVQDTSSAIVYSEGWTLWQGKGPRDDTLHYANRAGCTAQLTFEGTGVTLLHKTGPDCGIAEVTIDGTAATLAARIDMYSADVQWNAATPMAQELTPGCHTVTIRVTGEKSHESSNTYVQIVGFVIR